MLARLKSAWEREFLAERSSVGLGLFRIAVAATVGLHVLPTFLHMEDNYLAAGFREYNASFFPVWALERVAGHPDWVVWGMAGLFCASWLGFLTGFLTQLSGLLMDLACYYFYARNSLHIGTLSWDILLVTVFLVVATPYPGDCLSLDSLLRGEAEPWKKRRPFFIQGLLRMQLASTYFYTGLCKWTADGNWLTDNPYYYLMHAPPTGVIKEFPGRGILAGHPDLCWGIGVTVIAVEMTLPLWLYWRRTRNWAIAYGFLFHVLLLATMHVPTIFFFLFPPQFLLFVEPESWVEWLEERRRRWAEKGRHRLVYDGACGFCRASVARLQILDITGRMEPVDFRGTDPQGLHPDLTLESCRARIHLLEEGGGLHGGFAAFRRLAVLLPMLWPLAPLFHFPGAGAVGERVYDWVARNRFNLLHRSRACEDNACLRD